MSKDYKDENQINTQKNLQRRIQNVLQKKLNRIDRVVRDRSDFMKEYIKDLSGILDVHSLSERKILFELWEKAIRNDGKLILVKSEKEDIMENTEIRNIQTISNAITSFKKKKILIHKSGSTYYINEFYFDTKLTDQTENVKVVIEYNFLSGLVNIAEDEIRKPQHGLWTSRKE